jgi:hypothetical protein
VFLAFNGRGLKPNSSKVCIFNALTQHIMCIDIAHPVLILSCIWARMKHHEIEFQG